MGRATDFARLVTTDGGDEEFMTREMHATIHVTGYPNTDGPAKDVMVRINGQYMKASDLRQVARVFKRLADALDGTL